MVKTIGRPRTFDRNLALCGAMEAFWEKGYEGVTLEDLQKIMGGLTPPSFYAAFGSKEKLFREAVDLYFKSESGKMDQALTCSKTAREAIHALLLKAVDAFTQRGKPCGCMVTMNWVASASRNSPIRDFLNEFRNLRQKHIKARLQQGMAEGDLPAQADIRSMTRFYSMILDGLSLEARAGASRKALRSMVNGAISAWAGFYQL